MPESVDILAAANAFRFPLYPEGHEYWDIAEEAVAVEWRGGDRWAVKYRLWCYDTNGEQEYESIPSSRSDEFKQRFRHTRDEAIRVATEIVVPAERACWDARLARKRGSL
jgi:hypothetical protein